MGYDRIKRYSIISALRERLFGGMAGDVFRGMMVLATGTMAARVVGLAAIPMLTRIYSPEDFGILAVFTALVAMLVPVMTLCYVLAVPLPRHDGIAMNLMVLSTGLMAAMVIAVGVLLWAFGPALLGLMSIEILAPWWWLVLLGLVGAAAYEIMTMWATRRRAYKTIAQTQITQSVLGETVKIGLGLLAFKPFGLLLGQIAAQSGGSCSLGRKFWEEFRANIRFVNWTRLKLLVARYRDFPIYRLPSQFLLVFSTQAPLMFTSALYGTENTGQLGLALMALALPMNLLGRSMSKAYYAEIASIGRRQPDTVRVLTHDVIRRLLMLSILPAIVLFFFGPQLFSIVFGEGWRMAGELAALLAIYLMFQFIQAPVAHMLYVFEGQKILLYLNVQRTVLILVIFTAAYHFGLDIYATIFGYSVLMSGHYLFSVYRSLQEIPN